MYEYFGYGDKPNKDTGSKEKDSGELQSQISFANNIKQIMVTYKVAQVFKKRQKNAKKPIKKKKALKLRSKTSLGKNLSKTKFSRDDICDKVQNFMKRETHYDKTDELFQKSDIEETKKEENIFPDESTCIKNFFSKIASY